MNILERVKHFFFSDRPAGGSPLEEVKALNAELAMREAEALDRLHRRIRGYVQASAPQATAVTYDPGEGGQETVVRVIEGHLFIYGTDSQPVAIYAPGRWSTLKRGTTPQEKTHEAE